MAQDRPKIPAHIKRSVRQRCGFGCVRCGCWIYDIDHIVPWSQVDCHEPDNLTLLCPGCHSRKTKGLIPQEEILECNKHPEAIRRGATTASEWARFREGPLTFIVGNNSYEGTPFQNGVNVISIDNIPIIRIDWDGEGAPSLTLNLFDDFNQPMVTAEQGEIVATNNCWDFEFEGSRLIVREQPRNGKPIRDACLDLTIDIPNRRVELSRGILRMNGILILVSKDGLVCWNGPIMYSDCRAGFCGTAFAFGENASGAAFAHTQIDRYYFLKLRDYIDSQKQNSAST